jgi:hypothetical protein
MNCQTCNSSIDYRFATNCADCGSEATQIDAPPDLVYSIEKFLTWKQRLVNLTYVLASAFAAMISGAVVFYFLGALFYIAFLSGLAANPGDQCARGNACVVWSILIGAFLGTIGGTTFAIRKPLITKGSSASV